MRALLEDRAIDVRGRLDLVRGAIDAHRQVERPTRIGVIAALLAGGAWTVAAAVTLAEPVPPDWPGYLAGTLPLALLGAAAATVAILGAAHRLGPDADRVADAALAIAVLGQLMLVLALGMAIIGGPYGALTAAAGSLAAVGLAGMSLVMLRRAAELTAMLLLIAGVGSLMPNTVAWLLVGAAWTAVGLHAWLDRVGADPRPVRR
ncbi:MAG TPA: hypothetical protein VD763_00225 [Candidatus Saccharimonadales bacterium]|nr:hypothetical protein [Candidatus Saccharimonadales bacterium]